MKKKTAAMLFIAVLFSLLIIGPTHVLATEEVFPESVPQSQPSEDAVNTMGTPEILLIELGSDWAGRNFILKTDVGEFPGTIKADENGVLKTELGGSKNYILSAIPTASPIISNHPEPTQTKTSEQSEKGSEMQTTESGIPIYHMVLFFGGLAACSAILIGMRVAKAKRYARETYDDDDE